MLFTRARKANCFTVQYSVIVLIVAITLWCRYTKVEDTTSHPSVHQQACPIFAAAVAGAAATPVDCLLVFVCVFAPLTPYVVEAVGNAHSGPAAPEGGALSSSPALATPVQLTFGGSSSGVTHGLADFVAQEEMDRYRGFWWALDSTSIAFTEVRVDATIHTYRWTFGCLRENLV